MGEKKPESKDLLGVLTESYHEKRISNEARGRENSRFRLSTEVNCEKNFHRQLRVTAIKTAQSFSNQP